MWSVLASSSCTMQSSVATSATIEEKETKQVLGALQSLEEKIPLLSEGEVERKLSVAIKQIQQNEVEQLNLSLANFGRFYERTEPSCPFSGHQRPITCLVVLPNGQLASGSYDYTIKLWDLSSGSYLAALKEHTHIIWALASLPNGQLASGSFDNTIKLWDLTSRSCLSTLKGHAAWVWALAVLPNGQLASGSLDYTVKVWDLSSGSCLSTLQGHTKMVLVLAALPNGQLASGSEDNTIKLWDLTSHTCLSTLEGHTYTVRSLIALPNGQLASGSWDNTIKLWDLASGSCLSTLRGHAGPVYALATLPNGLLASGSYDSTIKLWDLASGSCLSTLRGHSDWVGALAILPNGLLASGSGDKTIKLWNPTIVSLSAKQVQPLLQALQTNTSVTQLDFSGHLQIADDIIDPLLSLLAPSSSSELKPNRILKTLNLKRTRVTKTGVQKLQKGLQSQSLSMEILTDWSEAEMLDANLETERKAENIGKTEEQKNQAQQQLAEETRKKELAQPAALQKKEEGSPRLKEALPKTKLQQQAIEVKAMKESNNKKDQKENAPQSSYLIDYALLELEKKLGKGTFGAVYKGQYNLREVAIKKLLIGQMTKASETEFKNDVSMMVQLKHPNIVALYGYTVSPYCMVMELMHTSLYDVLQNEQDLPWKNRMVIVADVTEGLSQLHDSNILHCDLKSLNILLSSTMRAKLADFGLSKVKAEIKTKKNEEGIGTLAWMAPELLDLDPDYSKASDIYAYGIVLWEIATRQTPYRGVNDIVIMRSVCDGRRPKIPNDCPPKLASLIPYCWHATPSKRPSIKEIRLFLKSDDKEFKPSSPG